MHISNRRFFEQVAEALLAGKQLLGHADAGEFRRGTCGKYAEQHEQARSIRHRLLVEDSEMADDLAVIIK